MKPFIAVVAVVLPVFFQTGQALGQEAKSTKERIQVLEEELKKVQEEIKIKKEPEKLPIKLGASITVRYDTTEVEDQTDLLLEDNEINGFRTRDRFWVEYRPQDRLAAGLRLSTGETPNPTSPFIRMGNAFRSESFNLDQFYIVYRPLKSFENHSFTVGKMPQPFWRGDRGPWRSELIWDDDVSPAGVALLSPIPVGSFLSLENTAGYFVVNEVTDNRFSGLTGDTYLVADQLRLRVAQGSAGGTFAVAIYDYNKLNAGLRAPNFTPGSGGFVSPGTSALLMREGFQHTNNRVNYGPGAEGFVEDRFTSLNFTAQLYLAVLSDWEAFGLADYVKNLNVDRDDRGYGITGGLRGGGKGAIAPFNVWLTYRDVDADATLATFADSDLGAGTALRGFEFGANYSIQSDLLIQISYFDFEGSPRKDNDVTRVFLDLVRTF